jgi:hypothetical protein
MTDFSVPGGKSFPFLFIPDACLSYHRRKQRVDAAEVDGYGRAEACEKMKFILIRAR